MKVTTKQMEQIEKAVAEVNSMSQRQLKKWVKENYGQIDKNSNDSLTKMAIDLMIKRIVRGNVFRDQSQLTEEI